MNGLFVLAMGGDETRRLAEQAYQHLVTVNQHIARARTHEELDTANTMRVGLNHLFQIVVGGTQIEGVIRQ